MKTVNQVSKLTGISIRTLHHYDAIGLLRPSQITESGYRLYDNAALARLQTILLFRELRFPLKEIARILDAPDFDPMEAITQQIHLLELQRTHLDELIAHAKTIQESGVINMNFTPYDTTEMDRYAAEAKSRWGKTEAYREFEQKTSGQTQAQLKSTGDGLMDIFARIGAVRHLSPASSEAQSLVKELQDYITAHFYTCTPQILRGLGQMYIAGDSMTDNIDKAGGPGTAAFANDAIQIYCE